MLYAFAVAFFSYNLSEVRIIGEGEILGALSFRLMKYHLQCSLFTPHFSMIIKFCSSINSIISFSEKEIFTKGQSMALNS